MLGKKLEVEIAGVPTLKKIAEGNRAVHKALDRSDWYSAFWAGVMATGGGIFIAGLVLRAMGDSVGKTLNDVALVIFIGAIGIASFNLFRHRKIRRMLDAVGEDLNNWKPENEG